VRQVTQEEFYEVINSGGLNVHPSIQGDYPYTSLWKFLDYQKYGQVFGKSVGRYINGKNGLTTTDYYLNN
jgi:hypothetical protein